MDRNKLPEKAFATDNRLLLHHTPDVKDGNAHATVDIDRLALCLKLVDDLPKEQIESAKSHLMDHVYAIAGSLEKAEATSLFDKIRIENSLMFFSASMSTIQEKPPIFGPANGSARFMFNSISNELFYTIEHNELSTVETAAHLHKGMSGTRTDEAEIVVPLPIGRIKEGSVSLTDDQAKMLMEGQLLVNIHSAEYPLGEIRGQIFPTFPSGKSINNKLETSESSETVDLGKVVDTKPKATDENKSESETDNKKYKKDASDDDDKVKVQSNEEKDSDERSSDIGKMLLSALSQIGKKLKSNKSKQIELTPVEDNEDTEEKFNDVKLSESSEDSESASTLHLELKCLNTSAAKDQTDVEKLTCKASFEEIEGKIVKIEASFDDKDIQSMHDKLPSEINSICSSDGTFLGMKAKIKEVEKIGSRETIEVIMEDEEEGRSFYMLLHINRDSENNIESVDSYDTYIPKMFIKDFAEFLNSLK